MRVVEDDTKTEDAIPYWKIDDFYGFPGFSWVWVVLRAARAKKVETKRFYMYLLATIGADTAENERIFVKKLPKNWQLPYTPTPPPHARVRRDDAGLEEDAEGPRCFELGVLHDGPCSVLVVVVVDINSLSISIEKRNKK